MLHIYYAVCFEGVIQALDTLLNIYIMNSWSKPLVLQQQPFTSIKAPNTRGAHRNFEKGFPPQLSDCYITVVYIA